MCEAVRLESAHVIKMRFSKDYTKPGFRLLYEATTVTSFIVAIPGIGVSPPEEWGRSSGQPWLETLLSNTAHNSSILCFDHGLFTEETFSWRSLVESGDTLLQCLFKLREDPKIQEYPFLFVCHSLGGIILKKALCLAQQDIPRFGGFLGVVSGLIMMGTPHSKQAEDEIWRNISLIPKASLKKFSKQGISDDETEILIRISSQFEKINDTPIAPILSAYEKRETRVRRGLGGFQVKSTLLVRKEFSLTHIQHEKDLGVDADHITLCDIGNKTEAFQEIAKFIRQSIETTQRDIFLDGASSHYSNEANDVEEIVEKFGHDLRSESLSPQGGKSRSGHKSTPELKRSHTVNPSRLATFYLIPEASDFAQKDPILPCFLRRTHIRNQDFFGRRDVLEKMEEILLPSRLLPSRANYGNLKTFGLCGMGGVGKTEIAVEFMFAHRDDYDAIFWVESDEPTKIADGFCQIALELGLEEAGTKQNQAMSRDLVKKWLTCPLKHHRRTSMPTGERDFASWLLIFDNVDDPAILNDYWPSEGIGSILVTSRDPLARGREFRVTAGVTLQPFEERDAAEFLVGLTENDSEDDENSDGKEEAAHQAAIPVEAIAIAQRLGGLPLALAQMAGVINRQYLSYKEFLSMYDQEKTLKELHTLNIGMQDTGYKHTLASVWALDRLGQGASVLLDVMSLFDPDHIPEDLLTRGADEISTDGYPQETSEYQKARAELTKSSLITRNKKHEVLRIHRLTQDGVRAAMDHERLQQTFDSAVTLISAVWPFVTIDWRHNTSRWERCETFFPHVLRLKNLYSGLNLQQQRLKPGIKFAKLLNDVGWYFYERSIPENCEPFFQLAQQVCESEDPDAVDLLSDIYYSRGADASEVNDPKRCMEYTSRFWKLRLSHAKSSQQGSRDIRLAMSYNQMGVAYMMNRDYESAIGVLEESLKVYSSLENYAPIMATLPAANMGLAYWFLGRYEEAYTVLINILREREKVFGKNDNESFKTGRVLHALGNVTASQGRLKGSYEFHQRSLLQYRSTIGDNHHRTADVCYKVAEHYMRFGKLEDAKQALPPPQATDEYLQATRKLLDQALRVFSSRIYYRHEKARTDYLVGKLMTLMGNEKKSQQHFAEAFATYQALKPEDTRPQEELSDRDFEELACFWSR